MSQKLCEAYASNQTRDDSVHKQARYPYAALIHHSYPDWYK